MCTDHYSNTIPKSNIKTIERGKIDTPNTQIHDFLLSLVQVLQ